MWYGRGWGGVGGGGGVGVGGVSCASMYLTGLFYSLRAGKRRACMGGRAAVAWVRESGGGASACDYEHHEEG